MPKPLDLEFDPIERARDIWERRFGPASDMAAATSIMRVQQLLIAEFDQVVRPYGLTFARYEALVLLSFSRAGRLPLSKIGERLMVHPTSVTNIVQRLDQAGFVVREPNPQDRRGTLAVITDKGREVVEQATQDLMEIEFGMGALSEGEREQLFALLRRLRVGAGDFREIPTSG